MATLRLRCAICFRHEPRRQPGHARSDCTIEFDGRAARRGRSRTNQAAPSGQLLAAPARAEARYNQALLRFAEVVRTGQLIGLLNRNVLLLQRFVQTVDPLSAHRHQHRRLA